VRRATGFRLKEVGYHLRSFADYSAAHGRSFVESETAIEWARQVVSRRQRARRLANVIRLARYLHAEDPRHEIPRAVFGSERSARRPPYIIPDDQIRRLIELAAVSGYRTMRRQTYSTLFALLSCTQPVRHYHARRVFQASQQLLKKPSGSLLVSMWLHKDIEDAAILVNGAP
jgi:integrase/recombinase XerD